MIQAIPAPLRRTFRPLLIPFVRKLEKRRLSQLYASLVSPGDLVFDVGAHTGEMAKLLLALGTKVICIEPQPACLEVLSGLFQGNPKVAIEPVGVGSELGKLELSVCSEGPQISTFASKWKEGRFAGSNWDQKVEVEVTTLDRLINKHGAPKFIKIDVEGFETEVLKGLGRPVPFVCFEFTREFLSDAKTCMERLETFGSVRYQVSLYTRYRFALSGWVTSDDLMSFLNGYEGADLCGDIYARTSAA